MKETGILRRIDELGRIVVPKEIRKKLKIREGDNLDIFVSEDNVILRKYSPLNDLEAILKVLLEGYKKISNVMIVVTDLNKIVASTKPEIETDSPITDIYNQLLSQKEQLTINKNFGVQITDDYKTNQNILIKPIINYGDLFGSVILFSEYETLHNQQEIIDTIHHFCTEYIQI